MMVIECTCKNLKKIPYSQTTTCSKLIHYHHCDPQFCSLQISFQGGNNYVFYCDCVLLFRLQ